MIARGVTTIGHPPFLPLFLGLTGANIGILVVPFICGRVLPRLKQWPRMQIWQWMLVVAVFAISLAFGLAVRDASFASVATGIICLIESIPMLAILIDFVRECRSHE